MTSRRFVAMLPVLLFWGAAAVLVPVAAADPLTFDPPIVLSSATGAALSPSLIVSGSNLYALWFQSSNVNAGQWDLMFRVSADRGATWSPSLGSPARNLSNTPPNVFGAEWPVAIATNGPSIYLAWADSVLDPLGHVFFTRSDNAGNTFAPPLAVSQAIVTAADVTLAIANGRLILMYSAFNPISSRRDLYVRTSPDGGTSWTTPPQLLADPAACTSESFSPQVTIAAAVVGVIWNCGNTVFRQSANGGLTFGTPQVLAPQNSVRPSLATASGTTYAAWTQGGPSTDPTVRFRRSFDGGLTWNPSLDQPATQVSDAAVIGADLGPRLVADASGVYLGWESAFGGNLRVRRSTDGGATWDQSVVALAAGAGGQLRLQTGQLFATSASPSGLLFTRSLDGGATWDAHQTIGNMSGNAPGSTAAVSAGDVYVAWQGEGFPANSLLLRHAPFSSASLPVASPQITQDYACYNCIGNKKFHTGIDLTSGTNEASPSVRAAMAGVVHAVYFSRATTNALCALESNSTPVTVPDLLSALGRANRGLHRELLDNQGFGNVVVLRHSETLFSLYAHLNCIDQNLANAYIDSKTTDAPSPRIEHGAFLGKMGRSGLNNLTKWPLHLHFETRTFGDLNAPNSVAGYTSVPPDTLDVTDPILSIPTGVSSDLLPRVTLRVRENGVDLTPGPGYGPAFNQLGLGSEVVAFRAMTTAAGTWYQVHLAVPLTNTTRCSVEQSNLCNNDVIDGWIFAGHIEPTNSDTVKVASDRIQVFADVAGAPQKGKMALVFQGQEFVVNRTLPGDKRCAQQWYRIDLGRIRTPSSQTQGWVCGINP